MNIWMTKLISEIGIVPGMGVLPVFFRSLLFTFKVLFGTLLRLSKLSLLLVLFLVKLHWSFFKFCLIAGFFMTR